MSVRKKAVVLLSGGLDSTTALAIARSAGYELYAMSFRYGQRHSLELESAGRVARAMDVEKHLIAAFDLRAIFQQDHRELAIETLPALLLPQKGRYGLRDYEKVFSPDLKNGPDIFDLRGVDRTRGALVVVRPDQYIAHVLPLGAHRELSDFFAGFMLPMSAGEAPGSETG